MSAVDLAENCLHELTRVGTNAVCVLIVLHRAVTAASESRGDCLSDDGEALA